MDDLYLKIKNAGTDRRFLFLKSSSGFTLIELIATMVIMAILASSTITNYSKFNMGLRIFEEVKDMSRKIIYARDYCTARKEIFYLKVDKDADQYSLFHQNGTTALLLPNESSHQFDLPSYVDISDTDVDAGGLEFDAVMGEPQGIIANATITIGDFTITIENPTGYIHVQ
ncbi:uncharacterized protein METZ01_LOCUS341519 [marine metagenome]|uniref:General secretion pathway GspH domain-containing protein n=1 Tax=marine metagenome TaxID=408172 RepID=A0A382QUW9_9ZZZZ